ncbi:unnamed protein product [Acanthoscelides obtectus]|uniref:C2H2-type domain-containing protein n=1 Tax=Acanthoscelides obtectus TaxID=200917 RepID=A0A9P0LEV5_ACAOB|nr:unnamed protein product [Acanthoscelides obtectus]CAK1650266.1 Zinc finger protein 782 [Acanthoscelides obtectus]
MKTENQSTNDPVWTGHVELLSQEECLPVIGTCQVTSILQNFDTSDPQNMDLIILPPTDLKLSLVDNAYDASTPNNYVILKDNGTPTNTTKKINKSKAIRKNDKYDENKNDNYENMLYFVCNLCPFLCTNDVKIKEHLENAHKNKAVIKLPKLKCPACPNIFYHRMSLRSHLIHDHGVGNSDLSQIIQAVLYYSSKQKENKQKTKPTKVKPASPQVEKHLVQLDSIDDHDNNDSSETVQNEERISLPQLDMAQNSSEKLISCLMKQSDPVTKCIDSKSNKCIVIGCKLGFQSVDKLNYHLHCHTEDGFKCHTCGENFPLWRPLTSHLWRMHKIDMNLYACDKCDYKTVSLSKLNNIHKLIHGEVKAFGCNICSKTFKNSKQLRNHKITHQDKTKKSQHICQECSKQFADKRHLRIHNDVVHKRLKPFLCNFCGYKGPSKSSLKMHIRQHTGEKPFECDVCSYTTSDHNSLRRHKFRHTGHKPYKCSYCSYACIQSSTYKTHLKTKHPGLENDHLFICAKCQFRTVSKDIHMSHMVTVHKMKSQNALKVG